MNELNCGEQARVLSVQVTIERFAKRLADMGLIPDIEIKCLLRSGGVACYDIRGASIMLREEDLDNILVTVEE